jgi:hypothetical protein
MINSMDEPVSTDVRRAAEAVARQLRDAEHFDDVRREIADDYRQLLHAIRATDARFAFDREGRPGAIDAVRGALPAIEQELFDAVIEDHACELAAIEESLFQVLRAYGGRGKAGGR